jgi:hypothetical protein
MKHGIDASLAALILMCAASAALAQTAPPVPPVPKTQLQQSAPAPLVFHEGCAQTAAEQCGLLRSPAAQKKCLAEHPDNVSDACKIARAQKPLNGGKKHLGNERPTATALAGNNQSPTPLQAPLQQIPTANPVQTNTKGK